MSTGDFGKLLRIGTGYWGSQHVTRGLKLSILQLSPTTTTRPPWKGERMEIEFNFQWQWFNHTSVMKTPYRHKDRIHRASELMDTWTSGKSITLREHRSSGPFSNTLPCVSPPPDYFWVIPFYNKLASL